MSLENDTFRQEIAFFWLVAETRSRFLKVLFGLPGLLGLPRFPRKKCSLNHCNYCRPDCRPGVSAKKGQFIFRLKTEKPKIEKVNKKILQILPKTLGLHCLLLQLLGLKSQLLQSKQSFSGFSGPFRPKNGKHRRKIAIIAILVFFLNSDPIFAICYFSSILAVFDAASRTKSQ